MEHASTIRLGLVIVFGALILCSSGCVYQSAVERGDRHAADGEWREALEDYRRAEEVKPESSELEPKIERARNRAVRSAIDEARTHLQKDAFEKAIDDLDYAERWVRKRDRKATIEKLRTETRREVFSTLDRCAENGEMREGYALAVRAREMFPEDRRADQEVERFRNHFYRRAKELRRQGRFRAAVRALEPIVELEPDRREEVASERAAIRNAWANQLMGRARNRAGRGYLAAAAALASRAFELSERETYAVQMRRWATRLRNRAAFGVFVAGPGVRDLQSGIREVVRETERMHPVDLPGRADLVVRLEDGELRCRRERVGEHTASTEYVAGTTNEKNPEHEKLENRLAETKRKLEDARRREGRRKENLREEKEAAAAYRRRKLEPRREELNGLRRELEQQREKLESDRQMLEELREQTERREERGDDAAAAGSRMSVEKLEESIRRRKERIRGLTESIDEAQRAVEKHETRYEEIQQRVEKAKQKLDETAHRVEELVTRKQKLERRLESTPELVETQVERTFEYRVVDLRRICRRSVNVRFEGRHHGSNANRRFRKKQTSRDEKHPAFPAYGVDADPLEFSTPKRALRDKLGTALIRSVGVALERRRTEYYRTRVDDGLDEMGSDPHRASDHLLGAYLVSEKVLDSSQRRVLREHLGEHYQGAKLETIAVE